MSWAQAFEYSILYVCIAGVIISFFSLLKCALKVNRNEDSLSSKSPSNPPCCPPTYMDKYMDKE